MRKKKQTTAKQTKTIQMNNFCIVWFKRLSDIKVYRKPYWYRTRSKTGSHRGRKRKYFKPRYKSTDKTFS